MSNDKPTIKEILASLDPDQRKQLLMSFNELSESYLLVGDSHYVGCHMTDHPTREVLEQAGYWQYGKINKEKK
jgi:hypothetical protein